MKHLPLLFLLLVAIGCSQEDPAQEIENIQLATEALDEENNRVLKKIRNRVDENGRRPLDVKTLEETLSLVEKINDLEWDKVANYEDVLATIDDYEKKRRLEERLARMEQLREKIDPEGLNESATLPFVQWELSKSLVLKELIHQQSAFFGTSDISFSACCNVNAATNYSKERIGKPTSIVLNDPRAEMKIANVKIINDNVVIDHEVSEMNDITMVNFTPSSKGDYRIQFETAVESYDTVIVEQREILLSDLAKH